VNDEYVTNNFDEPHFQLLEPMVSDASKPHRHAASAVQLSSTTCQPEMPKAQATARPNHQSVKPTATGAPKPLRTVQNSMARQLQFQKPQLSSKQGDLSHGKRQIEPALAGEFILHLVFYSLNFIYVYNIKPMTSYPKYFVFLNGDIDKQRTSNPKSIKLSSSAVPVTPSTHYRQQTLTERQRPPVRNAAEAFM
jgi:hypothetical protein